MPTRMRAFAGLLSVAFALSLGLTGCGHSEEEWQQAQRDIAKLKADLDAANSLHAEDDRKYTAAAQQIDDLKAKLKGMGVDLSKSEA